MIDGVYPALNAGNGAGGQAHGVCYEVHADDVVEYDGYNMSVNDKTFMTITSGATDDHHVPSVVYSLEGNGSRPSHQGTGYSADGRMFTLNTIEKHAVCYGISSYFSNAMLSDNPNSGIYEAKTSRCLDLNGGNPACHQGGMIIVYEGQSCSTDTDTVFTLQAGRADDHHICDVVYPITTGALCAKMDRGLSGQDGFNDMIPVIRSENMEGQRKYVIRRLTPMECARLQGFPDWWTDGVEGSDSNKYKMWGNGIALPCAADVIGRIAKEMSKDEV